MAELLYPDLYRWAYQDLRDRARAAGYTPADIAGISVGGCCAAIGTERKGAFRRKAHAHNHTNTKYPHSGWLCFLSSRLDNLVTASGGPTRLFAHEYAHLLVPNQGHTVKWGQAISALGHPADAERCVRSWKTSLTVSKAPPTLSTSRTRSSPLARKTTTVHLYTSNGEVACKAKDWKLCLPHLHTIDGDVDCAECLARESVPA